MKLFTIALICKLCEMRCCLACWAVATLCRDFPRTTAGFPPGTVPVLVYSCATVYLLWRSSVQRLLLLLPVLELLLLAVMLHDNIDTFITIPS